MQDNRPIVHGYIGSQGRFSVNPEGEVTSSVPIGGGSMLIDTGATATVIDAELASNLSLPETEVRRENSVTGIGGEVPVRQFTGAIYLSNWVLTIPATFSAIPLFRQVGFVAVIGMDILSQYVLVVDGPGRRVELLDNTPWE